MSKDNPTPKEVLKRLPNPKMWPEVSPPEPKKPSSLDERLREIDRCIGVKVINNPVGFDGAIIDARLRLTDDVIAQIKQAFKDEGWTEPRTVKNPCDECGKESSVILLMPLDEPNKSLCYLHYEIQKASGIE